MIKKIIGTIIIALSVNLMADVQPHPPTNLGAYNFTGTSARLSFKDLANNETGFRVYHNEDLIGTAQSKRGVGKYQYITLYNLESCKLYTVSIVAYNAIGESNRNRLKSFRTTNCTPLTITNNSPISKAGIDQNITLGDTVTLNGSGTDNDGSISSYIWKRGTETLGTTATMSYTPTAVGTEILTLIVTDDDSATGRDSVNVTILNNNNTIETPLAPINIGAYNFSNTSARLSFKDLADNEDGFSVYYDGAKIANVGAKAGIETYQYINIVGLETCKVYTIELVAYNSAGKSEPLNKSFKTIGCETLIPTNYIPTVNAGPNKSVSIGDIVTIRGSASDRDGNITSYIWKKGTETLSEIAIVNYTARTKGIKTLTLTVTDNKGATKSDSLQILVNDPLDINTNIIPIDITLFGAIPNDNIDDTEAIKTALAISGSITMPTGIYNVKSLIRFGTTIIDGNASTFKTERSVFGTSTNILKLKTESDSDRIWVKNLTLDGDCPTQYPTVGENIVSLIHIYDSKNIILEGLFVKDYSSQYPHFIRGTDVPSQQKINLDHTLDRYYSIFITFSRDIIIRNMEQENIKIEGPLIYESDNILIENFKSTKSNAIWTALHVVASDNIIMKHITVSDGSPSSTGSSINFFANEYFSLFDVNTTNKHGFDISNEVIDVPTGRVRRDTSYGTFRNCRFEGYHPVQAYPTKNRHKSLSFFNTKFIPSRVQRGANAIRFQKAGELLFDNCTFGSESIMTTYPMILGDTQKLTITNSTFLNTRSDPSVETGSIYVYGGEYGDLNITNSSFTGIDYTPIIFRRITSSDSNGKVDKVRFINNTITNEAELENGNIYKIHSLIVDDIIVER
ncbi:MAG TPA: hypothetical protein EYG73_04990 [Arcobacter sp.]|nr:hypothetical protein [Arcobacter sp.]